MVTTLPRVHVVIAGLDKLTPTLNETLTILQVLSRNATAQRLTAYVTWLRLPLEMMGQRKTAVDVAEQDVRAFFDKNYDAIITLCASCASHLKHNYPTMLDHDARLYAEAKVFADRITDFSSFVHDNLGLGPDDFRNSGQKVTHHASCHLYHGLGVKEAPHDLIKARSV